MVTFGDLLALTPTQVEVIGRGILASVPAPRDTGMMGEGDNRLFYMKWEVTNFAVTVAVGQDGTVTTSVDTIGRLEDFPLVGALMKFNTQLYLAFTEGTSFVYTGDIHELH